MLVLQESHGNGDEDRRSDVGDEPSESKLSVQRRSLDYDYFCPVGKSRQSTIRYNCHMFNMYLSFAYEPRSVSSISCSHVIMSSAARSPLSSSPSQRYKFVLPRRSVARTVRTRTWRAKWRFLFGFLSSNGPENAWRSAPMEGVASSMYHLVSRRNEGKVWVASTGSQRGTAWGYGVTSSALSISMVRWDDHETQSRTIVNDTMPGPRGACAQHATSLQQLHLVLCYGTTQSGHLPPLNRAENERSSRR